MTSPIYALGPETNRWPEAVCTSCGEAITPERGRAVTRYPQPHDECFRPCYLTRTRGEA